MIPSAPHPPLSVDLRAEPWWVRHIASFPVVYVTAALALPVVRGWAELCPSVPLSAFNPPEQP